MVGDADGGRSTASRQDQPGRALDRDIYEMTPDEMKRMGIRTTPGVARDAIAALEQESRVPSPRRRVHRGSGGDLDHLQAREGARSDSAAAASDEFYLYYDNEPLHIAR